ncbi:Peptidase M50B-like [Jatrophihabitans endophyticus]|uniref:Peptidase M50B-like n=1 Tax=Jatrophihabitans endophyticus TaxID=1206085 RepID=A0A1M5BVV4_9ACTN|nr:M50 family metallopeptidase [Jatrophihabitans endophyticus]SHF46648.1 Peptidase M50B-like [Jatrophihabitans endophyticus]
MSGEHSVSRVWDSITATQPAPTPRAIVACAVVALLVVAWRPLWIRARHLVTITHEGAHGVAALLSGRRLSGIRLHSDTSGLTLSRGRRTGPGMILTALAGYPGPALVGLGAAGLLRAGHAVALLWLALLLLALLLAQIRNWFGLWSVLVAGAAVFAVSWWASPAAQSTFAYTVTWFLLLAAPRPVLELARSRRAGRARDSDADVLGRLTRTPGALWVAVFLVVTVAALAAGVVLIAGRPF